MESEVSLVIFLVGALAALGGYMFYANRQMIKSGKMKELDKRSKKKREKERWSLD